MTYKLLSRSGSFLCMLDRIQQEGHDVKAYIENTACQKAFENIVPKAETVLELNVGPKDVIIFDMVGGGGGADVLIKKGYYVIGASGLCDELELDRSYGNKFMQEHDILVPPTREFNNFEEAKKFVEKTPDRYVFKPHGNLETDLTYLSSGPENLIKMFPHLEKDCQKSAGKDEIVFELQTFVRGTEMSTEAWFNGKNFILPINSTMEEKKLMPGNCGPNTGCMGNVVWVWDKKNSEKLYHLFFEKLEPTFRSAGYVGPLDINCIWTDKGPYGLEWSARFGYDAIQAFSRLIDMPFGTFLSDLKGMEQIPTRKGVALGVRVSIPPYPQSGAGIEIPKVPIMGITPKNIDKLYFADVLKTDDGEYETAGVAGDVLVVCDVGRTLSIVNRDIYTTIEEIELPEKQYRIDIGDRVEKDRGNVEKILDSLP